MHVLDSMDLSAADERRRVVDHVHEVVSVSSELDEEVLLGQIKGFPGLLEYWRIAGTRGEVVSVHDLGPLADQAHDFSHRDLARRLSSLRDGQRSVAVRLALMSRLDNASWATFREVILGGVAESAWHELNAAGVLRSTDFPSFGHDTDMLRPDVGLSTARSCVPLCMETRVRSCSSSRLAYPVFPRTLDRLARRSCLLFVPAVEISSCRCPFVPSAKQRRFFSETRWS